MKKRTQVIPERFHFIDYAKFVAIIAICVGHFLNHGSVLKVILYSFHVPVFFVISGFLSNYDKNDVYSSVSKLIKRIVLPYTFWFLLSLTYYPKSNEIFHNIPSYYFFYKGVTTWNSPLWFMPVILYVSLIFLFIIKISEKTKRVQVVSFVGILSLIVTIIIDINNLDLYYFGLDRIIHMLGYMCIGYFLRNIYERYCKLLRNKITSVISTLMFLIFCIISVLVNSGNNISILSADYNNILIYIPLAIIGSISFIFIFVHFKKNTFFEFLSKNTVFYMGMHYYFLNKWIEISPNNNLINFIVGLSIALIISLFCVLHRYIVNTYSYERLEKYSHYIGLYAK